MSKKNTVKNVRVAAAQVVVDVTKHGRSLAEVLPAAQKNIAEQDAALLAELCYGTLRCYFELEALAAQLLQKPPRDKDADIHALLLLSFTSCAICAWLNMRQLIWRLTPVAP
ncbi:MAG TPA: transcription antitermination factor NusB [Pseudomonadales bacterium]|nr:transcription antitermination factor NusB [Pseudomonadales bacterium]